MDGFEIEGIDEFYKKLKSASDTLPDVVKTILETLGQILLDEAASALRSEQRPHARYAMLTRTVTRGPNKGRQRNYLKYVGSVPANSVDTGKLWRSLSKNAEGNVWTYQAGGTNFVLRVGSSVNYAKYINDGYTVSRARWVPGTVDGSGIFRYQRGADTGILVHPRTFKGVHFFEIGIEQLEKVAPDIIRSEIERWLENAN